MYLRDFSLLAALVWFATTAVPASAVVDSTARARTLHDLATRIHAAANDVNEAHNQHRAMTDVATTLTRLRGAYDAALNANFPGRTQSDEIFANKLHALAPVLAGIERASRAKPDDNVPGLTPAHLSTAMRGRFGAMDERGGGACNHALGLGAGIELEGRLREQAEVWFRFEARGPALYRVSTAATPADTEIAVYAHCPKTADETPLSLNDDAFALAAAAPIDLRDTPGPRWVRVRNLGPEDAVAVVVQSAGTISGRVTDQRNSQGVPAAHVRLFTENGGYAGDTYVNPDGTYSIPVPAGSYHAVAGADRFLSRIWPQGFCSNSYDVNSCDTAHASLIVIAQDASVTGIDFVLDPGASVSGRVREHGTGIALSNTNVTLVDSTGQFVGYSVTDIAGRYDFHALLAGNYYALATSNTHKTQIYENIDCSQSACNALAGTPIAVASDAIVQDIDFSLTSYLYLNATVQLVDNAVGGYSTVNVYDAAGAIVLSQLTSNLTQATPIGPLDPGSYRVAASASGHFSQLYDHVDCATDCAGNLANAAVVTLSNGGAAPALTFDLQPTPTVSGRITDSVSGLGLANTSILLISANSGYYTVSALTSADGTYNLSQLAPGSYYVVARSNDHHDEAYPNAPCLDFVSDPGGCSFAQAQAIGISFGVGNLTNIDMALVRNSSFSGKVQYRAPGTSVFPATGASVTVFDAQGHAITSAYADGDGVYRIMDLVAGTYYAQTSDYRFFSQAYAGVDCPIPNQVCNPTGGTPIVLGNAQDLSGVDFDPVGSSVIVGRVTDLVTGLGIVGAALDTWDGSDNSYCSSTATDANGYYLIEAAAYRCYQGTRKISTDAGASFIDQIFSGISCPAGPAYLGLCSLANATLITVPTTQPQPVVANFVLHPNDVVFANGFD